MPDDPTDQNFSPRRWVWAFGLVPPLMLVWSSLNGWDSWQVVAIGFVAAAAASTTGTLLAPGMPYRWRPLQVPGFVLFFARESFRGGIDVAARALHPALPVSPHFVEHPVSLPAGQPRTLMICLVSLLPGTLAVDFDEEAAALQVHVLAKGGDATLGEIEERIARLFGLPAPAAPSTGSGQR